MKGDTGFVSPCALLCPNQNPTRADLIDTTQRCGACTSTGSFKHQDERRLRDCGAHGCFAISLASLYLIYKEVDRHGSQQFETVMSATFQDAGLTVADVQTLMSMTLHPAILLAFCHGIHTCIFFTALYYISKFFSSSTKSPISCQHLF